jgi:TRAP-type C4-dicarboxylate transport system permease small subunit
MDPIIRGLGAVNAATTRIAGAIATALLMAMLGVVIVHVFFRYVLGDSFGWTEEVSRTMMVWMAFLYFPMAHREGLNVSLDLLIGAIRGSAAFRVVGLVIEILVLVLVLGAVWWSWGIVERAATSRTLALQIPSMYIYAIMPIGFGLVALSSIERTLKLAINLFDPDRYDVRVYGSSVEGAPT